MENKIKDPPSPSSAGQRLLALALTVITVIFVGYAAIAAVTDLGEASSIRGHTDINGKTVAAGLIADPWDLSDDGSLKQTGSGNRLCLKTTDETKLIPGGIPFGMKLRTEGVLVIKTSPVDGTDRDPAAEGGIIPGDIITEINGEAVNNIGDVTEKIQTGGGKGMIFTVKRNGETKSITVTPVKAPGTDSYRAGLWLRDGIAGIGTVTYIDPSTLEFGGLGHGICDSETGILLPTRGGVLKNVTVSGAIRGIPGLPGELKGSFAPENIGRVTSNTNSGVFGKFDLLPIGIGEPVKIAKASEVREGEAYILSTVNADGVKAYGIAISEIDRNDISNKNFVVTVTDEALIEQTGGIVQGMSGSPIIQDGKLIGAVTHVLINNPVKGYGIFIENMLNAAE